MKIFEKNTPLRFLIFCLSIVWGGYIQAIEVQNQEKVVKFLMGSYIRSYAKEIIEQYIPPEDYSLQVKVSVDREKLIEEGDFLLDLKLPYSNSYLKKSDIDIFVEEESFSSLLGVIRKVKLKIRIAPTISSEVRSILRKALKGELNLISGRGDRVELTEAPLELAQQWRKERERKTYSQIELSPSTFDQLKAIFPLDWKNFEMFGKAALGVLSFLIVLTFIFLFRMVSTFSIEGKRLSNTLKEGFESQMMNSPDVSSLAGTKGGDFIGKTTKVEERENLWERVDLGTLQAFLFDCHEDEELSVVPLLMVSQLLTPDKAEKLNSMIPNYLKDIITFGKNMPSKTDIETAFLKNQIEYKKCSDKEVGRYLFQFPVHQIKKILTSVKELEAIILLGHLTPLKRTKLLASMPTELKISLTKKTKAPIKKSDIEAIEKSLLDRFSSIPPAFVEDTEFGIRHLGDMITMAQNFEEDEIFYTKSAGEKDWCYSTVLHSLSVFEAKDWEGITLQNIALAFGGYSVEIKKKLYSNFSGKKLEWLKSFMDKFEGEYRFDSQTVRSSQIIIKELITKKMKQGQTYEKAHLKLAA